MKWEKLLNKEGMWHFEIYMFFFYEKHLDISNWLSKLGCKFLVMEILPLWSRGVLDVDQYK